MVSGEVENRLVWEKNPTHLVSKVVLETVQEHTDLYLEVIIRKAISEVIFQE